MWIELGGTVISEGILWGEGLKPTKKKKRTPLYAGIYYSQQSYEVCISLKNGYTSKWQW